MAKGRKAKPNALKRAAGNPGKRPLPPEESEPEVLRAVPPAPAHVEGPARVMWDLLGRELIDMGVLTASDLLLLEIQCVHYGIWRALLDVWREAGELHPAMVEMRRQAEIMLKIAPEFGLSPSSRAKAGNFLPENVTVLAAHRATQVKRRADLAQSLRDGAKA